MTTISEIIEAVSTYYKVDPSLIIGGSRSPKASHPRHVAMYLSREMTSTSFPLIARRFGGRHHSSVMYAHRNLSSFLKTNKKLAQEVFAIQARLSNGDVQSDVVSNLVESLVDETELFYLDGVETTRKQLLEIAKKDPESLLDRLENIAEEMPLHNLPNTVVAFNPPPPVLKSVKKMRTCLGGCSEPFLSDHNGHRICPDCAPSFNARAAGCMG